MVPMPTDLPEWATGDVLDPISGQYNVAVPPSEVMIEGWRLGEKPNRQWWNWFNRTVYDWINYFNDNLDFSGDQFTPIWANMDLAALDVNYGFYSREGDKCFFTIHVTWNGNASSGNFSLTNLPFTAKNAAGFIQTINCNRGAGPTLATKGVISGQINNNTTEMLVWQEDLTTGAGIVVNDAEASGQLIFSGFYFIEPF